MPIVEVDIEGARHGDDQLLKILVGVPAALCAAWYVIEIVDTLDGEGDVDVPFDERQIASRVVDAWQIDDLAVVDAHVIAGWQGGGYGAADYSERFDAASKPAPRVLDAFPIGDCAIVRAEFPGVSEGGGCISSMNVSHKSCRR